MGKCFMMCLLPPLINANSNTIWKRDEKCSSSHILIYRRGRFQRGFCSAKVPWEIERLISRNSCLPFLKLRAGKWCMFAGSNPLGKLKTPYQWCCMWFPHACKNCWKSYVSIPPASNVLKISSLFGSESMTPKVTPDDIYPSWSLAFLWSKPTKYSLSGKILISQWLSCLVRVRVSRCHGVMVSPVLIFANHQGHQPTKPFPFANIRKDECVYIYIISWYTPTKKMGSKKRLLTNASY